MFYSGNEGVRRFLLTRINNPIDTTGAGDSFNAAFLASRMQGDDLDASVAAGHTLAARVILTKGAIIRET